MSLKKADKYFKKGQDNLTTGIFQWNKDFTAGASNFSEALKLYNVQGRYDKSLLALKQLIVCNQALYDNWAMARNYEQMLDIYLKHYPDTSVEELTKTARLGFHCFRMADSIDKGLHMLGRVAKQMMSRGQTKEGIDLLQECYKSSLDEDKSFKKKDLFYQVVQVYLQNELYQAVERIYYEQIKYMNGIDCNQNALVRILAILMQHEANRAQKEMYQISNLVPGFLQSDECQVADQLIKAYKKGDADKFLKWSCKPQINSIFPVIVIKKLREVKVPSGGMKQEQVQKKQVIKNLLF